MENISEEERRAIARKLGAQGGAAKAARRSPEERSAEMRERVGQFWAKLSPEERSADSGGSRPAFRDDLARHSDLMSLGIPR